MISAVITAGGSSSRFKGTNKLLYQIDNQPIIWHTVKIFNELEFIDEIIIPANKDIIEELKNIFQTIKKVKIIQGGDTRQESVYKGLTACKNCSYAVIHDGARPFIKKETIIKCLEKAKENGGAIVGVKSIDTIKIADEEDKIVSTPERRTVWNAQTPQIFEYSKILKLHEKYRGQNYTDDALLFEKEGIDVYITEGEYSNFKITTQEDINRINNNCK